ncbi:hypothetical protein OG871_29605 [Kitasatospora sp. NBC_00374]|uniref:hypothetical protein n=1 Tax=Kitasatospora sp. NBC_00374 TaxID=2975964 RepID=UPI0030E391D9
MTNPRYRIPEDPPDAYVRHEETLQLRSPWVTIPAAAEPVARGVERVQVHTEIPKAVFVDQSGRRGRALRGLGWIAGLACAGFAATALTTVAGSNSQAPAMPIPTRTASSGGQKVLGESGSAAPSAAATVSASPSPSPGGAKATGKPSASASAVATGPATGKPTGTARTATTSAKPAGATAGPGAAAVNAVTPRSASSAAKPR